MEHLVLVNGVLEYVEEVVQRCRQKFNDIQHRQPVGLLDQFDPAFGMLKHARRVKPGRRFSSSSAAIGIHVHEQLDRVAQGDVLVDPHPFTLAIAKLIRERGWFVVASELPIVAESINLYTRADLLLFDPKANVPILVELKTGRDHGYSAPLVSRRAHIGIPDALVRDSEKTRAHLQLAWMYWALLKEYSIPRLHAVVIVANARGVRAEKLAKWARTNAKIIYERVADTRSRTTPATASSITSESKHN